MALKQRFLLMIIYIKALGLVVFSSPQQNH